MMVSAPNSDLLFIYRWKTYIQYSIRQSVCSLTHSARTPPARARNIFLGVGDFFGGWFFFGGGVGMNFFLNSPEWRVLGP